MLHDDKKSQFLLFYDFTIDMLSKNLKKFDGNIIFDFAQRIRDCRLGYFIRNAAMMQFGVFNGQSRSY
jgi:hypothetical protein